MQLKVVSKESNTIILELEAESVTVPNMVRGELWEDENVSEAAYVKEHPYLKDPQIFVKTSKGKPETALDKATDRLVKKTEEFSEKFKKALKE